MLVSLKDMFEKLERELHKLESLDYPDSIASLEAEKQQLTEAAEKLAVELRRLSKLRADLLVGKDAVERLMKEQGVSIPKGQKN